MRHLGLSGDQVTWSKETRQRQQEDTLYAWLSFDEVASYEEDVRLKTEDLDEEDEKEREECSGMSTTSANKLQILWDYFIHAEPHSYEVLENILSFISLMCFLFSFFESSCCLI